MRRYPSRAPFASGSDPEGMPVADSDANPSVSARARRTIDAWLVTNELPDPPRWQGVNHLALVTPDMDATVRFYDGVLGMRLVATTMAGPMRHYFFETSPRNTIAFFEMQGRRDVREAGAAPPADFAIQFDHISFDVPDEHALELLRKRLLAAGSEVDDRSSTTASSGPCTSPTRTGSRSRRRGGSSTGPAARPTTTTGGVRRPRPRARGRRARGRAARPRAPHAAHVIAGRDGLPVDPEHDLVPGESFVRRVAPSCAVEERGAEHQHCADGGDPSDREPPARPVGLAAPTRSAGRRWGCCRAA